MKIKTVSMFTWLLAVVPSCGYALHYHAGDFNFSLTGYGTVGIIEPNFKKPDFLGDFRVRGQVTYDGVKEHIFGAVYMIDEIAINEDKYWHDMFGFWQWRGVGRVEFGLTDSVAHKLGLGLPDVGGLRLNDNSLIFRKMGTNGPVIANPEITSGTSALRLNLVAAHNPNLQYGVSVAGITGDYKMNVDAGIKIKHSSSKTKYALSLGASFIDSPDGYETDTFRPLVTADWRGQVGIGTNIQYNSWIFALTGRIVYDENPIGTVSDGIVAGTGLSYDILNYTLSVSYLFSETGIWHKWSPNYADHTAVASFRYKYNRYADMWASIGISREKPFVAAGLRATF
ncbi:MAG: hypothetical protein J6Y07_00970 [Alphaproteobacteria bacterium]|nr:hypothetical protein [Alphaproteobacteria bacterium]